MGLRALRGSSPPPLDSATLGRIADAVEAVTTARFSSTMVYAGRRRRDVVAYGEGFHDYPRRLEFGRYQLGGKVVDQLRAGPDVLLRLSPEEQRETGKTWKWHSEARSNWDCERAQTVATLRHRARPIASVVEELEGDEVYRYSLLIELGRRETDPLLAGTREDLRQRAVKRQTFDVWLSRDGQLRQTREHAIMSRAQARPGELGALASFMVDNRDFGIVLEGLAIPTPDQVFRPEPKTSGLTVIIDGQVSSY